MDNYIDLLDRLTKEKELNNQLEKEIGSAELNFLWTSVVPLLDFLCFVNYERKYQVDHLGTYYDFSRSGHPEDFFREVVRHNVFHRGQFHESFNCNPEIIDIRVERSNSFFKLKITGINWVTTPEGLKEEKKSYNTIDELVLDITKFLVDKAVIIE
jgi:hypothetical protein